MFHYHMIIVVHSNVVLGCCVLERWRFTMFHSAIKSIREWTWLSNTILGVRLGSIWFVTASGRSAFWLALLSWPDVTTLGFGQLFGCWLATSDCMQKKWKQLVEHSFSKWIVRSVRSLACSIIYINGACLELYKWESIKVLLFHFSLPLFAPSWRIYLGSAKRCSKHLKLMTIVVMMTTMIVLNGQRSAQVVLARATHWNNIVEQNWNPEAVSLSAHTHLHKSWSYYTDFYLSKYVSSVVRVSALLVCYWQVACVHCQHWILMVCQKNGNQMQWYYSQRGTTLIVAVNGL